jgi:hypothetical protein
VSQFGITLKSTFQDVEITVADAAKFRALPTPEYDEKGNLKPMYADLKDRDRALGGVKGDPSDVKKDVWIVANLTRNISVSKHVAHVIMVLGEEEQPGTGKSD